MMSKLKKTKKQSYGQLCVVFLIVSLFWMSLSWRSLNRGEYINRICVGNVFLLSFFILFLFLFLKQSKDVKKNSIRWIRCNKGLVVLVLIMIFLRIPLIGTMPRWDTETYFLELMRACENFEFSWRSFIDNFRLCAHPSLGYSLFLAIGASLTPYDITGVNMVNIVLSIFAMWMLYEIVRVVCPGVTRKELFWGTLLISAQPMFLGTFANLSLDYGIALFIIYIMYFHIKKYYILFCFFACVLVQTKEIGVVVLAGYLLGGILYNIVWRKQNIKERNVRLVENKIILILFVIVGLGMLRYLGMVFSDSTNVWSGAINVGSGNVTNHYFGISLSYILQKLKTIFLLNFSWLFVLILFLSVLKLGVIGKLNNIIIDYGRGEILWSYIGSLLSLIGFSCIYVTYNNPRYHLMTEMGWVILTVIVLAKTGNSLRIKIMILSSLIVLELLQSFTTVDPVTINVFSYVETGNNAKMIHTGWEEMPSLIADIAIYNNQYTYLDEAYDKILEAVDYTSEKDVIVWGEYGIVRATFIEGMKNPVYWNDKQKERTYKYDESCIPVDVVYEKDFLEKLKEGKLKKEAILIETPIYNDMKDGIELLERYYEVGEKEIVSICGKGEVYYYKMKLK